MFHKYIKVVLFLCASLCSAQILADGHSTKHSQGVDPIAIKVVVVTMFENGEHTGDRPGEMQFWIER